MGRTKRWLSVIVVSLVAFGVCVWLGDVLLPWDPSDRIATGAGAGAVIAGLLGTWASTVSDSPSPAPPTANGPTASGERSVAVQDNSGVIITGDNGTVQR